MIKDINGTGAKLLVEALVAQGTEFVFGVPGAKVDACFDALRDSPIRVILCRHEQAAAFMAAAYGRLKGLPGVVLSTSGPGVSNLATGLLTANTENDPVVAIGGNVTRAMAFKEVQQNTENTDLLKATCKNVYNISIPEQIPEVLANAFRKAVLPPSGAVFLSIPQDILQGEATGKVIPQIAIPKMGSSPSSEIQKVADALDQAKNPVLLLGLEAGKKRNTDAFRNFLRKYKSATVITYQAAGVISRDLVKYFVGRVGLFRNQPGDQVLKNADLVVTIGFRPVEYNPIFWNPQGALEIIHLNYDPCSLQLNYQPKYELIGDIKENLEALTERIKEREKLGNEDLVTSLRQELFDKIESGKNFNKTPIHPLRFIYELRNYIDDDTIIASDIGSHYMWLARYLLMYKPRQLLISNGQQTLGVALPWAISVALQNPKQKIISISGDGGFLYSASELETAMREGCNFIHFVWCDGAFNMVLEQAVIKYNRSTSVDIQSVDVVKFAESFGAHGFRVNKPEDITMILKKSEKISGPILVEVPIDYSDNRKLFEDQIT